MSAVMSTIPLNELLPLFGQYIIMRKNNRIQTELQDEYFDTFMKAMGHYNKIGFDKTPNDSMLLELVIAYMKQIPQRERDNNSYKLIAFHLRAYIASQLKK